MKFKEDSREDDSRGVGGGRRQQSSPFMPRAEDGFLGQADS